MTRTSLSIGISIVAILAIGVYLVWFSPQHSTVACSKISPSPVIVALGDSLVAGYGAPEQQGFVMPLSAKLGIQIINKGEDGDTTAQALSRIPDVLAQHPNVVIVLLGGNDALQRVPVSATKANLESILTQLTQNHIQVVLVGVLGGITSDPFASMFQQLAAEFKVTYVPNILSGLLLNSKYMYDEVHPNATGYDIAASKIFPAVQEACAKLQK